MTAQAMTTLYRTRGKGSLGEAVATFLRECGGLDAALLYSPAAAVFASGSGSGLSDHGGAPANTAGVFEARMFSAVAEMRWWLEGGRAGCWALASAQPVAGGEPQEVEALTNGYVLWGRVEDGADGWSRLVEPRIGSLWVPHAAPKGARVFLKAEEQILYDPNGNAYVLDERLTGFEHREAAHG